MTATLKEHPIYHSLLGGLLAQRGLKREIIEDILDNYKSSPVTFEGSYYSMEKYLVFMGLRQQDADHVTLAFHSQIRFRTVPPSDQRTMPSEEETSIRDLIRLKMFKKMMEL